MMLKMLNPFGSLPSVGVVHDGDSLESKEEQQEQERLRQDAVKQAERERREKYRRQEEEREQVRQAIREKYGIQKPIRDDDDYEIEDDDSIRMNNNRTEKSFAEKQLSEARMMAEEKCVIQ